MRGSNYVVIPLLKINCFIKLCFVLFLRCTKDPIHGPDVAYSESR